MSKNKCQKKSKLLIINFLFLLIMTSVFSVSNALAACPDGTIDPGEECDGAIFPGGATRCADLGDSSATGINPLVCDATCNIDWTASACSGGFGSPLAPSNVPTDFETSIMNLTNWILGFVAMIAILAIIWGGLTYMGSAGDENKATTGKRVITYALIGLVVSGIAYAIVNIIVTVIL